MLSEQVFKSGYSTTSNSKLAGREKNDCFVRACSNAFGISYEAAHEFVADKFNRKDGKGTKMCNLTLKSLQKETIEFKPEGQLNLFTPNGGKHVDITHVGDGPKQGGTLINPKNKYQKIAYTVKTFMQKFTKGTYILLVNKHALVCKNGVIFDNNDMQFNGYRRPIESAFLIREAVL